VTLISSRVSDPVLAVSATLLSVAAATLSGALVFFAADSESGRVAVDSCACCSEVVSAPATVPDATIKATLTAILNRSFGSAVA
jgi:hypothetical protein